MAVGATAAAAADKMEGAAAEARVVAEVVGRAAESEGGWAVAGRAVA